MSKIFYSYDNKKLVYSAIPNTQVGKIKSLFVIFIICATIGFLFFLATKDSFQQFIISRLNIEKGDTVLKFDRLIDDLEKKNAVVKELQKKDDKLYRTILNIAPLDPLIREAGFGGSNYYSELVPFDNADLMINVSKRVDILTSKLSIQKKSYDKLYKLALEKGREINCTPSIQPISVDDFIRISDYFGYRIDPFSGCRKMHCGIDISGPRGAHVYTSAEGVVTKAEYIPGYGKLVEVNHGFNLQTRYGHLDDIHVKTGQKINRGFLIGSLGNTGRSTAPHLHYEVHINGKPTNPLHFFCNNISATEYNRMIKVLNEKNVERFIKTRDAKN